MEKLIANCDLQLEFIEWLKEKRLYNPMDSAFMMQKMYNVWINMREDNSTS
jgi:hypothetical protein